MGHGVVGHGLVGLQGTPTKPSLPPRTRIGHSGLHHIYPYPAGMFLGTDSAWRPRFEAANSTRGTWQTQLWLAAWPSCTTRPSSRTWRPSTSFTNPLSETPALPQKSTGEINACSLSFLAVRELLVASGGDTVFNARVKELHCFAQLRAATRGA